MMLHLNSTRRSGCVLCRWLVVAALAATVAFAGFGVAQEPAKPVPAAVAVPLFAAIVEDGELPTVPLVRQIELLQTQLEQLAINGKTDEVKKVAGELKALKAKVAALAAPVPLPVPVPLAAPIVRGDFAMPVEAPAQAQQNVRKQYEEQLKQFEQLIDDAKDDEAKASIRKAQAEYKKSMADTVKKSDEAAASASSVRNRHQDEMQLVQQQLQLAMQEQQKMMQDIFKNGNLQQFMLQGQLGLDANELGLFGPNGLRPSTPPRFGVQTDRIPESTIDQLDLPKDSGILIVQIIPGSVAEKVGVKKNDILLSMAGKDVPTDTVAFAGFIAKIQAADTFDVVVLRKGKRETIKAVQLPEVKKPEIQGVGKWTTTQIQINGERATMTATSDDGIQYKITGAFAEGKLTPDNITVDGKDYANVIDVPVANRARVKQLLGQFSGGVPK